MVSPREVANERAYPAERRWQGRGALPEDPTVGRCGPGRAAVAEPDRTMPRPAGPPDAPGFRHTERRPHSCQVPRLRTQLQRTVADTGGTPVPEAGRGSGYGKFRGRLRGGSCLPAPPSPAHEHGDPCCAGATDSKSAFRAGRRRCRSGVRMITDRLHRATGGCLQGGGSIREPPLDPPATAGHRIRTGTVQEMSA